MTDFMSSNVITDAIRTVLVVLVEKPAYLLLKAVYQIFFNIANAEIVPVDMISNFYDRIQLIIGIFMIFKLTVIILQSIVNPDKATAKETGMMSIIGRVFIVLVLLTVITPLNIKNPKNEYEISLDNNGILFGVLYSLQHRILENNTISKLVLGTSDDNVYATKRTTSNKQKLEDAANRFASSVLKVFLKVNVVANTNTPVCSNINKDLLKEYNSDTADPQLLLNFVNLSCNQASMSKSWQNTKWFQLITGVKKLFISDSYAFAYFPLLGGIVAFILSFILLGFCLDIAIRAVKLAVLRLIAPIPIISYITPSKDNGAFGTWVKNVTSTYLDLFIRLVVVNFILSLIGEIIKGPGFADKFSGITGGISYVIILIGLFIFAREAPKFFRDVLGLKGNMSNIGLSAMLGGAAMAGGGIRSGWQAAGQNGESRLLGAIRGGASAFGQGALTGERGAVDAYNQGKQLPLGSVWSQNRDLMEQIRTGDKDAHGGFIGRLQDRLNYTNRDMSMGAMGMGKKQKAQADWWKKKTELDLADAQNGLKNAEDNLARYTASAESGSVTFNPAIYNNLLNHVHKARENVSNLETRAAKAGKNAENISKYREANGAKPRIYDKVHETYRSDLEVTETTENVLDSSGHQVYNPDGTPKTRTVPVIHDVNGRPTLDDDGFNSDAKPVNPFKGA